jgi:hypothetical protein
VRQERGIDIAGRSGRVVGQSHGRAADNEHISDDAPAREPLTQIGKSAFEFCTAEEHIVRLTHAASKSLADR